MISHLNDLHRRDRPAPHPSEQVGAIETPIAVREVMLGTVVEILQDVVDGVLALNGSPFGEDREAVAETTRNLLALSARLTLARQSCATNIGTRGVGFRLTPNLIPDPIQEHVALLAEHGQSG
jgi:hypothetical protein